MSEQPSSKKAANLSVNADLLREAKALNINLSQAFENHLAELVKAKKGEKWLAENRQAMDAYNELVERIGVFSEGFRTF